MSGLQGGDFWTGFASGSISSLASSLWSGGKNISYDENNNVVVKTWDGFGGKFSQSTTGIIAFGTIAGGAGATLSKGNFWQGAVTGLVVSGLNHALHKDSSMDFEENITTDPPHVGPKVQPPNPQDLHESFNVPKGAKWTSKGGRPTIKNSKGEILQWDSKRGEIEKYNPRTKEHKGGFDPNTGKFRKGSIDNKRVPTGGWKLFSIGRFFMLDFLIYHTLKTPESYMQDARVII